MPETFEQSEEEKGDDESASYFSDTYFSETPTDYEGKSIEEMFGGDSSVLVPTPQGLLPDQTDFGEREREERADEYRQSLNIDLSGIKEFLEGQRDIDFSNLDNGDILQLISQNTMLNARLNQIVADTMIEMLSTMVGMASSVEPASTITVSGVNVIDEAGAPETVIPQSDDTEVPTKVVFIRASPENDETIYFGDDEVAPEEGYVLRPGEAMELEIDFRSDQLYMASEDSGVAIQIIGML